MADSSDSCGSKSSRIIETMYPIGQLQIPRLGQRFVRSITGIPGHKTSFGRGTK